MAVIKSGSFETLLFDTEILFKFLKSFKVFGSEVNKLSSILNSSNLQKERKSSSKNRLRTPMVVVWWGKDDASLKVKFPYIICGCNVFS